MGTKNGYSKYITFKARIGCYIALSITPILESESRMPIVVIALIVSTFILFIEKTTQRKKILCVWIAGFIASIFTVMVTSIFFIQLSLYIVGIFVASGIFHEMEASIKDPKKGR